MNVSSVSPERCEMTDGSPLPRAMLDRVERLGQRADLVHLDQDRVGDAVPRCRARAARCWSRTGRRRRAGTRSPIASRQLLPAVPVVLGQAVLDRDDRILVDPLACTVSIIRSASRVPAPLFLNVYLPSL